MGTDYLLLYGYWMKKKLCDGSIAKHELLFIKEVWVSKLKAKMGEFKSLKNVLWILNFIIKLVKIPNPTYNSLEHVLNSILNI